MEEYGSIIAIVLGTTAPIYAGIWKIWAKIGNLCERIAKEETKSDIFHPKHDLEDK